MRTHKPTLSAAMIVRDGGDLFRQCLASIHPVLDDLVVVDTGSEDDSREIAKSFGARLFEFPWIDDFAAARNESFRHVKTDYAFWVDHDDLVLHPENLRIAIEDIEANPLILGCWYPYQYAFDEHGNLTTLHRRERLMRMSVGWRWKYRIHEVCEAQRKGLWSKRDDVIWKHQRPPVPQTDRNLRLLYMQYAENADDLRTIYNIGHQYFTAGDWPKAIEWLERFAIDDRGLIAERWQALCYISRAQRMVKEYEKALATAFMAIGLEPKLMDGYLQVSEVYRAMEDWERAITWALFAREHSGGDVPEPVFANPVEDAAQAACILSDCYGAIGKYEDALRETQMALQVIPAHKALLHNQKAYREAITKVKILEGFQVLADQVSDSKKLTLVKNLNGLADEGMVRDITIPALMRKSRRGTQPRIVFYCGNTLDEWSSATPSTIGIGGAETAVVEIARRFAKAGWSPVVYNKCGKNEGLQDGVLYADFRRWPMREQSDIFVAWRGLEEQWRDVDAPQKWLWVHDLNRRDGYNEKHCAPYDRVLGVSQFHADYLANIYPFLSNKIGYVNNGINLDRFQGVQERVPHRAIWTSSPDRGLIHLLELWPIVRSQVEDAELHIFYGWENIDKMIAGGARDLAAYKALIENRIQQPGIEWRGRVPQAQLAKEFQAAQLWTYPTSFVETFCIGAVEAMAGGALVATSDHGNLPNVVGDAGLLLRGHPANQLYRRAFAGYTITMMQQPNEARRQAGYRQAQRFTWDASFQQWVSLVEKAELVRV